MIVRVKLFALAAQLAATDKIELSIETGQTVGDLRQVLAKKCPALVPLMPHLMFAINSDYAGDHTPIPEGTEIACIPPVSGG
jgi:molybdopterin converting factor subunit 1